MTITGKGFTGATAVKFGATDAASFTVNSATSITAVSPAASSGMTDVTVTTPGGTSPIVTVDHFTFAAPRVTGVSPASGSKAGGTTVTISGNGFALGASTIVKFGTAVAPSVNCTSTTSCTASSPARSKAGKVDVSATVAGKKSPKNAPADQFEYL